MVAAVPASSSAADTDDVEAPDWDEEACEEAEVTADEIAEHDPDAAEHLYRLLAAARKRLAQERAEAENQAHASAVSADVASAAAYDPMRLYAQLAKYYGFSDKDIEQMHFPRAFAYYREAVRMQEEEAAAQREAMEEAERKARRKARRSSGGYDGDAASAEQTLAGIAPRPRLYQGQVVRLVD